MRIRMTLTVPVWIMTHCPKSSWSSKHIFRNRTDPLWKQRVWRRRWNAWSAEYTSWGDSWSSLNSWRRRQKACPGKALSDPRGWAGSKLGETRVLGKKLVGYHVSFANNLIRFGLSHEASDICPPMRCQVSERLLYDDPRTANLWQALYTDEGDTDDIMCLSRMVRFVFENNSWDSVSAWYTYVTTDAQGAWRLWL